MSLALLNKLNGGRKSHLYNWLLKRPHEPRICWYPSCWGDFRNLLYLHKSNLGRRYPGMPEPPDFFIHTDCSVGRFKRFHDLPIDRDPVFRDEWTIVSVLAQEELPRLEISRDACEGGLSQFPASDDYGRIFFVILHIESDRLGTLVQPLIYAIVENGAFASDVLLPSRARVTHIWNVLPGGHPNPWIGCLLRRLRTQCLVRENGAGFYSDLSYQREGYRALFPDLEGGPEDLPDAAVWQPLASWEVKVDSTGLEVHVRTAARLEIERETLEYLWDASAIDPQLQARAEIETHGLWCTITGLDLYARRMEAAEAITADIVFALGDAGLNDHMRRMGPVDLLHWTDKGHSQYCACWAPFYRHGEWCSRRIFWSAWNPDGRISLSLGRPARKPIEQEFLLLLAAIEALQRCARTGP